MEIHEVLIFLSSIVLFSYAFDIFSSKTRVPSVVLLLGLGVVIKFGAQLAAINLTKYESKLNSLLPVLGTLGLIFIVLEGALELNIDREKKPIIVRSLYAAFVILMLTAALITLLLYFGQGQTLQASLLNAMPLSVISSAIAIPSVQGFAAEQKEFIVYETSFSDILGVMFFNFALINEVISFYSFVYLGYELILILILSVVSTILLGFLFERLRQHKKFMFVLAVLVFVYGMAKSFHLSALIVIFIFGMFAGNSKFFLEDVFKTKIKLDVLQRELHQFQSFVTEFAFVLRTFFFVVFGFSIKFAGLLQVSNIVNALIIVSIIFGVRFLYNKVTKTDPSGVLWLVAPRGLITILLFYSIPATMQVPGLNTDVLLLVILCSIFMLSIGGFLGIGHKAKVAQAGNLV
jgi:NhaP-type Na+/H+ or K+/H+ antiporter